MRLRHRPLCFCYEILRISMAHAKIEKTNAARLLDRAKIAYELVPYQVDEEHLAATHVAEQLGEAIESVFKTLVLKGDRTGYFVCVVPGDHEVDLKAAARVSGNKKVDLIPMKELLPVTGYIRGGCSPIGMRKSFPTYIHESVAISARESGVFSCALRPRISSPTSGRRLPTSAARREIRFREHLFPGTEKTAHGDDRVSVRCLHLLRAIACRTSLRNRIRRRPR